MAYGTTTTANVTSVVDQFYTKDLLDVLYNNSPLYQFAYKVNLPSHNSKTVAFRRYDKTTTWQSITDGVQPPFSQAAATDTTVSIGWYGAGHKITDQVTLTIEDPIIREHQMMIQETAKEKLGSLILTSLYATNSVWACYSSATPYTNIKVDFDGSTFTQCDIPITTTILETAAQIMRSNLIKPVTKQIMNSTRYGSSSLPASYLLFAPTATQSFWRTLTGFIPKNEYSFDNFILDDEIGAAGPFRIILDDNMTVASATGGGNSRAVYPFLLIGMDGSRMPYGVVELDKKSVEVRTYARGTSPDYWAQFDIVTGKFAHASVVLNDDAVVVLYAEMPA